MPIEEFSDHPREEVDRLIRSRSAFKGTVTRHRTKTLTNLRTFKNGEDPTHLELILGKWEEALTKYSQAEEKVRADAQADVKDSDIDDIDDHENLFFKSKAKIIGYRRDFDKSLESPPLPPIADGALGGDGQTQTGRALPRLTVHLPQTLQEDVDLRSFLKWKPTWANYSRLMSLSLRPQATQISVFWQCCSPGFFRIVEHSIGIKADTGRSVDEVIQAITAHLRSLRNPHVDMKEFLSIRQKDGQDYSGLCNEIRELGEYADTSHITEDHLHIGILVQAMRSERDRAKLLEENPKTFEDARRFILSSETARQGAKQVGPSSSSSPNHMAIQGFKKSSYSNQKLGFPSSKPPPPGNKIKKDVPRSTSRYCCGGPRHQKNECPAKEATCSSCKRTGHYSSLCRSTSSSTTAKTSAGITAESVRLCSIGSSSSRLSVNLETKEGFSSSIKAIPDTGAEISVMGFNRFISSGLPITLDSTIKHKIITVDGSELCQKGSFRATISVGHNIAQNVSIAVCMNVREFYLDLRTCQDLNIIGQDFPKPMSHPIGAIKSPSTPTTPPSTLVWSEKDKWIRSLPEHSRDLELFKAIETKLQSIYAKVFDDSSELRPMTGPIVGEPMKICLKDDY